MGTFRKPPLRRRPAAVGNRTGETLRRTALFHLPARAVGMSLRIAAERHTSLCFFEERTSHWTTVRPSSPTPRAIGHGDAEPDVKRMFVAKEATRSATPGRARKRGFLCVWRQFLTTPMPTAAQQIKYQSQRDVGEVSQNVDGSFIDTAPFGVTTCTVWAMRN